MPIITATWSDIRRAWLVALPGGVGLEARDQTAAEQLTAKHAPGSSLRFVRGSDRAIR